MDKICYPSELLAFPLKQEILNAGRAIYCIDLFVYLVFRAEKQKKWVLPVLIGIFLPNLALAIYTRDIYDILVLVSQGVLAVLLTWGIRRVVFASLEILYKRLKIHMSALIQKALIITIHEGESIDSNIVYITNLIIDIVSDILPEKLDEDYWLVRRKFVDAVLYAAKKAYISIKGDTE